MRVIFVGTPEFAARALQAIVDAGHAVPLVLTQPDRPAGRGQRIAQSPVRILAGELGLPVHQPRMLRSDDERAPLLAVSADVMVVAAYGLILPQRVLDHPAHGCLNIHASLLPRWRGAAPIQRAILTGDHQTGVCIMQMEAGLDTGPVISRFSVDIAPHDNAGTLHDKLAATGSAAITDALSRLAREGRLDATAQPTEGVTYAPKIERDEARIDWSQDAAVIARQVRAFNPAPGAFTSAGGAGLKVWAARASAASPALPALPLPHPLAPGELALAGDRLFAGTGNSDVLALDDVQPAGSRRMSGDAWARGRPDLATLRLGT